MLPSFFKFDHGVYTIVILSFLFPVPNQLMYFMYQLPTLLHTLNTIRLGQLRTINQKLLCHLLPVLALR